MPPHRKSPSVLCTPPGSAGASWQSPAGTETGVTTGGTQARGRRVLPAPAEHRARPGHPLGCLYAPALPPQPPCLGGGQGPRPPHPLCLLQHVRGSQGVPVPSGARVSRARCRMGAVDPQPCARPCRRGYCSSPGTRAVPCPTWQRLRGPGPAVAVLPGPAGCGAVSMEPQQALAGRCPLPPHRDPAGAQGRPPQAAENHMPLLRGLLGVRGYSPSRGWWMPLGRRVQLPPRRGHRLWAG